MRVAGFFFVAIVFLGLSTSSRAQNTDEEAKACFNEGVQFFKAGKYEEAVKSFRKAYEFKPNWKLNYNIGQSEAAAKRHGLALLAFEAYLSQGGDDIPNERRDAVLKEVERLRKMVGSVEVKAPSGAQVYIDGIERGRAPLAGAVPIEASVEHKVVIVVDGRSSNQQLVQVMGGQMATLSFEEKPAVEEEKKEMPEPQAARAIDGGEGTREASDPQKLLKEQEAKASPVKIWGWVAVGVGAAMAAGGAVAGGISLGINKDLEETCDPSCTSAYQDDVDRRDNLALAADITIPTGAALAVTGILMVVLAPREAKGFGQSLVFLPFVGRGGLGSLIGGEF